MTEPHESSRDEGGRTRGPGPQEDRDPEGLDRPISSAVDEAGHAGDGAERWVFLEPPNAVTIFWWRAFAVSVVALTLVLLLDLPGVAGYRSGGQWTLLAFAMLSGVVGSVWLWVAAALPRPVDREIARLHPGLHHRQERRRLSRALRGGEPLDPADRPAAAALTARRYGDLRNPGVQLTLTGFIVTLVVGTSPSVGSWMILPWFLGALCVQTLLAAHSARTLYRAAVAAGVAPLVSDAPRPLADIGPTAAR